MIDPRVVFALVALGASAVAGWALREVGQARAESGGEVVAVDVGRTGGPLRAPRWGIVGRPDEIVRLADGREVPVEVKSRTTPRGGIPDSHRLQVYAYLALLDDQPRGAPPFGVLRYGDGREFRVPWNDAARQELAATITEARRPYDGRARPGPDRCPRCPWYAACDARWPSTAR
ncbi:MAG: PD-(D/E)XK nuclease family protein [Thermoplasmata archaeon]|nr:PD-(D/E)XK nuclease family protein [Thermoplasmata archaeon]